MSETITIELTRDEAAYHLDHCHEVYVTVDKKIKAALAAHDRAQAEAELGLPWEAVPSAGGVTWLVRNGALDLVARAIPSERIAKLTASAPEWKAAAEVLYNLCSAEMEGTSVPDDLMRAALAQVEKARAKETI